MIGDVTLAPKTDPEQETRMGAEMERAQPLGFLPTFVLGAQSAAMATSLQKLNTLGDLHDALARTKDEEINPEQFKSSPYYREGLSWVPKMTTRYASILASHHDTERFYSEQLQRGGFVASLAGGLVGGMLDPINFAMPPEGLLAGAFGAARWASMGRVTRSLAKAEAGISSVTALMQPLDMYVASKTQDEYDAKTFAMNMVGALEFGAFVGLVHAPWERLPVRDKALVAQKAMFDIANGKPVDVAEPIKYSSPESFKPITTEVTADMPMERISALNPKAHESIVRNLEVIRSEMVRDMEFNPESKWGGDDYRNVGLMIEGRELEVPVADRQRLMREAVGEVGKPIGESKILLEAYRDKIREDMIANPESSAYGSEDWVAVNAIIEGRERGIPEELSTRIKQTALGEKTLTRESFLQPTVLDEAGKVYEAPVSEPVIKGVTQKPTHIVAYVKGQFLDRLEKWTGIVPKEFFMEKNNRMLLDLIHDSEAMDLLLQLKDAGVDRDLIGQFMLNKDALKNLTWEQIRDISPVAGKMAKRFTLFDEKIEKVDVKGEPREAIASDHVIPEETHPAPKDDPAPVAVQAQKKLESEPMRSKTPEQERWDADGKELEHQIAEFIRVNFDEANSVGIDLHKEVAIEKAGYLKAKKKGEVYKQLDICMRA